MSKHLYILAIFVTFTGCGQSTKKSTTNLNQQAKVTLDSCKIWGKPLTSFQINFPSEYKLKYNKKGQYITLTYSDSAENVIQEISLGKSENLKTKMELEEWTVKMDSLLRSVKGFTPGNIVYDKFAGKNHYILRGFFDFSSYSSPTIKGQYNFLAFIISPEGTDYNGVTFSVITKKKFDNKQLSQKAEQILETLTFKND